MPMTIENSWLPWLLVRARAFMASADIKEYAQQTKRGILKPSSPMG